MSPDELVKWLQAIGWEVSDTFKGVVFIEESDPLKAEELLADLQNEEIELHPDDVTWRFEPLTGSKNIIIDIEKNRLPDLLNLKTYSLLKQLALIEDGGTEVNPEAPEVKELEKRGLIVVSSERISSPTDKGKKAKKSNPAKRELPVRGRTD